MGACIIRVSPRNIFLSFFTRFCDENTVVKDALIPDPSLDVADRLRGAVLLLVTGHRFSKLKQFLSGLLVAGNNFSQSVCAPARQPRGGCQGPGAPGGSSQGPHSTLPSPSPGD